MGAFVVASLVAQSWPESWYRMRKPERIEPTMQVSQPLLPNHGQIEAHLVIQAQLQQHANPILLTLHQINGTQSATTTSPHPYSSMAPLTQPRTSALSISTIKTTMRARNGSSCASKTPTRYRKSLADIPRKKLSYSGSPTTVGPKEYDVSLGLDSTW